MVMRRFGPVSCSFFSSSSSFFRAAVLAAVAATRWLGGVIELVHGDEQHGIGNHVPLGLLVGDQHVALLLDSNPYCPRETNRPSMVAAHAIDPLEDQEGPRPRPVIQRLPFRADLGTPAVHALDRLHERDPEPLRPCAGSSAIAVARRGTVARSRDSAGTFRVTG